MGTVSYSVDPMSFRPRTAAFPAAVRANGTTVPYDGIAFDASTNEEAFFRFRLRSYGSGSFTVRIMWYALSATSGNVVLGAAVGALTPNVDTDSVEAKGLATEATITDSHLGTVGKRLHEAIITVASTDSAAEGDEVRLRIRRLASDGGDTMTGDCVISGIELQWSDT